MSRLLKLINNLSFLSNYCIIERYYTHKEQILNFRRNKNELLSNYPNDKRQKN